MGMFGVRLPQVLVWNWFDGGACSTTLVLGFHVDRKGASPLSMGSLCGVGDLVLTCTGSLSRNWTVGNRMAKGEVSASLERLRSRPGIHEGGVLAL